LSPHTLKRTNSTRLSANRMKSLQELEEGRPTGTVR
jgi:hypothetical protein